MGKCKNLQTKSVKHFGFKDFTGDILTSFTVPTTQTTEDMPGYTSGFIPPAQNRTEPYGGG